MRCIKAALLCICFAAIFLFPVRANAADDAIISNPLIIFEDSTSYSIDMVDKEREPDKIIMYTKNYGEFTEPFAENTHEYVIVNNIVVHKNTNGAKGTYIPSNGYVISYTGKASDFINNLSEGCEFVLKNIDIPSTPDMYFKLDNMVIPIDQANSIRDANQIILYNPVYGTSTKTNAWGMELTVVNGVITKLTDMTDNNSPIPSEGMVISIHSGSSYYKAVHEKAKPGIKLEIADGSSILYSAAKTKFAAYNPRTIADNPAAWDVEEGKPYDSFRGPNQLIIYDSSYGDRTGTNPYGYEIRVSSEGKIISTGGNDSIIPVGGYILSGHGDYLKWLEKNALLGSTVIISMDKKELSILLTPDSYINRAAYSIKSAQENLDLARQQYMDIPYDNIQSIIDSANYKLNKTQDQLHQGLFEGLVNITGEIQKDADNAYYMTFESPNVENRAVWLRPKETNVNEVIKKLEMLKDLNINTIYLETYWNGYAIYPTGNELMQQNPMFKGFDVLASYIKEAHSRGIELHAWIENFLVDLPIAEKKPEWMAISRNGEEFYLENGKVKYYFMNPALPEVRGFLSELYKELVRKYTLDGLQLDYIRYPHSGDYSKDFGYDTYTRKLFENFSGTDPIILKPGDTLWEKWNEFRAYLVSSYAYRVISEVKSIKPEIHISADVWPEYDKTLVDIYQDTKAWVRQDYLNTLIPMSYYLYEEPVVDDIINTWAFAKGHSQVTSGIATYTKVDKKVLIRQVDAIRTANTNGVAIFEFDSIFKGGYDNALKLGAFSTPAVVTNRDPDKSIELLLKEIMRKIDDIYIKYNGINAEQAEKYKNMISEIRVNLEENIDKSAAAYSLKHNLEEIFKTVNSDVHMSEEISKRICFDINRAINIIDAYIADIRFISNHIVKEFQVELPFKTLESSKAAPVKVKAIFSDNTEMYLGKSQYTIKSGNLASVDIVEDMLVIKAKNDNAEIIIDIKDNFNFNTVQGINRKFKVVINQNAVANNSIYCILKASETGYSKVQLDWNGSVIDSDIAGYIVYRSDKEICRTSSCTFTDRNLQPGETYTYIVHGFDSLGNILYRSNQISVKTRELPLLCTEH